MIFYPPLNLTGFKLMGLYTPCIAAFQGLIWAPDPCSWFIFEEIYSTIMPILKRFPDGIVFYRQPALIPQT